MEEKRERSSASKWIVLGVLVLSFTSSFLSRFIWAPIMTVASNDLMMSMIQAGNLMSGYYFGYLFTQVPGGYLADKFKVKYMLAGSVLLVALSTFCMSLVDSYTLAYVVRFIGGLVSGATVAFCSRIISDNFLPKERAIAFGIFFASPSIGSLLSNLIGPMYESVGWRNVFKIVSGLIFVVFLLDLIFLREPRKTGSKGGEPVSMLAGLRNYFTNREIVIISIAGFLYMAIPAGYITWANKFMTSPGPGGLSLTVIQASMIVTIYSVFSIAGSISSGFIAKRFHISPKNYVQVVFIIMSGALLAFGLQRSFAGLVVTSIIFGTVSNMAATHLTSWAVNMGGNKYAAMTTSIQNLLFQSSNVIFPTIIGSMIDARTVDGVVQTFNPVWILYAVLMFVAFIVITFTNRKMAIESMK